MMSKFYQLKVLESKLETKDSVSVSFEIPLELYKTFNYRAGQYLTLKFNLNGEEVRRSYSICSSPALEEPLRVGVKRIKNGLVSNHINENLKAGNVVEVMPPEGRFFVDVKNNNYKTYYLFSAGSGITPILSILRTILFTEERSYVYMVYGNRSQESIMFKEELEALHTKYADRFVLKHVLSRPNSGWSDLWSFQKNLTFRKGRVDSVCVEWFVNEYPPYAQNAEYYICGPGTMIENTKKTLKTLDVPNKRIFIESFGTAEIKDAVAGVENAKLIAYLNGEKIETSILKGKTILRALIDSGTKPPYSCEGGVCATCMCKIKKGEVYMKNNLALDDTKVKEGYILSCQSIPLTNDVEVDYTSSR